MRQNELFRLDPSVRLVPPPHPLRLFLRKYTLVILNIGTATFLLATGLLIQGLPTRLTVFNIAAGLCFLLLGLTTNMIEGVYSTLGKIATVLENHRDMAEAHDKILAVTVKNVLTLTKTTGLLQENLDLKDAVDKHLDNK